MPKYLTRAELQAGLPDILASPAEAGELKGIVVRPGHGERLAIGTAVLEITAEPHNGCKNFAERYGREACAFVNSREGKRYRLRGIYARVVQDGRISLGDKVVKLV